MSLSWCQSVKLSMDVAAARDAGCGSGHNQNFIKCKAPVNSPPSPPPPPPIIIITIITNIPTSSFYMQDAPPVAQPTMSKH